MSYSPFNDFRSPFRAHTAILILVATFAVFALPANAQTWTRLAFAGQETEGILVDPTNPNVIYLGLRDGQGAAKSLNGGGTWSFINNGLVLDSFTRVRAFGVDPTSPNIVFLSMTSINPIPNLYKSTDGGATWNPSNTGLPEGTISTIRVDPISPNIVYIASNGFGVAKSLDGGATWSDSSSGLEDGFCSVSCVLDLAIDPVTPSTLYIAQPVLESVFKSIDGGATWNMTSTDVRAERLKMHPSDPLTLVTNGSLGGLEKTTDGALTWTSLEGPGSGLPSGAVFHDIAFHPTQPDELIVEADFEMYRSTDAGLTWTPYQDGLGQLVIYNVAHSGASAFVTTEDGIYGTAPPLFADDFESGDTMAWSLSQP